MKMHRRWTVGLLLTGLLAAGQGVADDRQDAAPGERTREQAREAAETAAREAIRAVRDSSLLDLDIRLTAPTSVAKAGGRQAAR